MCLYALKKLSVTQTIIYTDAAIERRILWRWWVEVMQKEAVVAYFKDIIPELTWKDSKSLKPSDYCISRRRFEAGASSIQVTIVTAWTNTVCLFYALFIT
jgi:hypothetical protein